MLRARGESGQPAMQGPRLSQLGHEQRSEHQHGSQRQCSVLRNLLPSQEAAPAPRTLANRPTLRDGRAGPAPLLGGACSSQSPASDCRIAGIGRAPDLCVEGLLEDRLLPVAARRPADRHRLLVAVDAKLAGCEWPGG